MKAKLFVLLFGFVVLIALTWMLPIPRVSAIVFAQQQGIQPAAQGQDQQAGLAGGLRSKTPTFAGPPAGMQALPIDLFLSKNFYKDQKLWSDQRYFRCNTPRQITDIWTSHRIGDKPPL